MAYQQLLRAFAMLMLVCSLPFASSYAQDKIISGKITDSKDGLPVAGASVVPKGSTKGTSTGADGTYRVSVGGNVTTLVVSSIGYATQEVDIGGRTTIDISLVASNINLNEVVVVGYGTARKRDLTGSVSSVSAKDFNRGQVNSPEQLLQGKVPGIQITNSSGQPGGLTIVKIRGNNSIRTGNTPLYVVDGVPLDGRSPRPGFNNNSVGTSPPADPLTFINPNEVASIDVLKDASAAAIYGSRGANGVVLLTTKKGAAGPARIDVNANAGFGDMMRKIDVLDAAGYRAAIKQFNVANTDSGASINPFKEIIRTAFTQNYSVALSGGTDNGKYRASFFVGDQDGIILKTNLKKYVGNFNGQYKFLDKKLSIDFSATAAHVTEHIAPISQDAGSNGNMISLALIWNPTLVMRRPNGLYNQENKSGQVNPLALSDAYNDITNTTTVLGNLNASYKFFPWLEYRFLYGVNYGTGNRKAEIQGWVRAIGGDADGKGAAAVLNNQLVSQTITHTLQFNKDLTPDLSLNALAGYEYWKTNFSGDNTYVYQFDYNIVQTNRVPIHYYDNMADGNRANLITGTFREPKVELQSYFARASLNYKDRYLLTATIRADGSSKFGSSNKYAYFPSVAAAWNITNEDFLKDNNIVDVLKLRVGYGTTGNQEFPADAALDVYRYGSYGSLGTVHFGNKDLKWETVKAINVGVDFTLFGGRLFGSVDYFDKNTKEPIALKVVTQPTGAGGTQYFNLAGAKIKNNGVEILIAGDVITGRDFNWTASGNVTFVKNRFSFPAGGKTPLYLTGALHGQGTSGAFAQAIADGQPLNVFYLNRFDGFDKDGIGMYTEPPAYVGDPNPKAFMGFNSDFTYKKWGLNIGFHGSFGNKLYNNTAMSVLNIGNINGGRNMAAELVGGGESTANFISTSTRYLESGSFLKMHNATLKYSFGDIGKLRNLTVSVMANNLFVISKYKGFDPEVNVDKALNGVPSLGIDYIGYPTQRTFLLGVSFTL